MLSKMWDDIIYPFPNFNGFTVEVWEWINNFIPHFIIQVSTYPWLTSYIFRSMFLKNRVDKNSSLLEGCHRWSTFDYRAVLGCQGSHRAPPMINTVSECRWLHMGRYRWGVGNKHRNSHTCVRNNMVLSYVPLNVMPYSYNIHKKQNNTSDFQMNKILQIIYQI